MNIRKTSCALVATLLFSFVIWQRIDIHSLETIELSKNPGSAADATTLELERATSADTRVSTPPGELPDEETINRHRLRGVTFLTEQNAYADTIDDPEKRSQVLNMMTTANRLWLCAFLVEMAQNADYADHMLLLFNDGNFRKFMIDTLASPFPKLEDFLKRGKKPNAAELKELFRSEVDHVAEFEESIAPNIPLALAGGFEGGIGSYVVGDVLHYSQLQARGSDHRSGLPFFWNATSTDPID